MIRVIRPIAAALLFAAPLAGHAEAKPAKSPFAAFAGSWLPSESKLGCKMDPHPNWFEFSEDRRTMFHYIGGPIDAREGELPDEMLRVAEFQIVQTSPHVRVRHEYDTPTLPNVFDLVFMTPDSLCWQRPEDPAGSCALRFERCRE